MIVSSRISQIYDNLLGELELLKKGLDPVLSRISSSFDGFFTSRIKSKESFAQKIETGRFGSANKIIDLYAATIVVSTYEEIDSVEREIEKDFNILKRIRNREKSPSDFIYDDVHLYIQYRHTVVPGKEYLQRPFELQLKTFLQHGWTKATHDILYKGKQLSWPRFRIAHQIKAMLEQSDQILVQIDKTANICPDNSFKDFAEKNIVLKLIEAVWSPIQLPSNVRGLINEIHEILRICDKPIDYLKKEFDSGRHKSILTAKSITPYQAILGILIKKDPEAFYKGLKQHTRKIYISKELKDILGDIPEKIISVSINL